MKEKKPKCCFQDHRTDPQVVLSCQFNDEPDMGAKLIKVGRSYYCPYHLPFERAVEYPDNNTVVTLPKTRLKTNWTADRSKIFNDDILQRLQSAREHDEVCDLTGVVFPESFECNNLNLPAVSFYKASFSGGHANFSGSTFQGWKSDFEQTEFSGGAADFSNAQFLGHSADFSNARFVGGDANFESASFFVATASFQKAEFSEGDAIFRNVLFLKSSNKEDNIKTTYETTEEEKELWAEEEKRHLVERERNPADTFFYEGTNFEDAVFAYDAQFVGANFSNGPVRFRNAEFKGSHTDFEGAKFAKEIISFFGTKFFSDATSFELADFAATTTLFESAEFGNHYASFSNATFSGGPAEFTGATFDTTIVDFTGSVFNGGHANFDATQFKVNDTYFCDVAFSGGPAIFTAPHPSSREDEKHLDFANIDFRGATFATKVDFGNRAFQGKTYFDGVEFSGVPEFHGCTLHQDTTFPRIENFRDTQSTGAARAYRTLRLAMKQQEAHEEEAMFWALEQRSKRYSLECNPLENWKNLFNWIPWLLSGAYALLSNYGLSINRPLIALAVWLFGATPISYFCLRDIVDKLCGSTTYSDLLGFSIAQSLRPFFIWGDYDDRNIRTVFGSDEFSFLIKMLATVDSIVSLTLIALFILAVRRRFRMQ